MNWPVEEGIVFPDGEPVLYPHDYLKRFHIQWQADKRRLINLDSSHGIERKVSFWRDRYLEQWDFAFKARNVIFGPMEEDGNLVRFIGVDFKAHEYSPDHQWAVAYFYAHDPIDLSSMATPDAGMGRLLDLLLWVGTKEDTNG